MFLVYVSFQNVFQNNMNTLDFHTAIAPQLKTVISQWLNTGLTWKQNALLCKKFGYYLRQQLKTQPACPALTQLLKTLAGPTPPLAQQIDQCCEAFFITMQKYAHIDTTGSTTIRVRSYHPRLKTFLNQFHTTLVNVEVHNTRTNKTSV
jgi:hypothetical protein